MLTVALPKGRISTQALELFSTAFGKEFAFNDRELILNSQPLRFLLVRNQDVPTYVGHGAADLGVVGLDVLEERGEAGALRLLDLQIGRCKVVLGSHIGAPLNYLSPCLRVATKMVNITRRFFSQRALAVDIIKLYGSIELAPLVGLAEGIVDIVETGTTMKQNNLQIEEVLLESSAYLIANTNSFFVSKRAVLDLQDRLFRLI